MFKMLACTRLVSEETLCMHWWTTTTSKSSNDAQERKSKTVVLSTYQRPMMSTRAAWKDSSSPRSMPCWYDSRSPLFHLFHEQKRGKG